MEKKTTLVVPESTKRKILELKRLETFLGHLPIENWSLNSLQDRVESEQFKRSAAQMDAQTEILFSEICSELVEVQFSYADIVNVINAELCYQSGPRYCNEGEVREALGVSKTI